MISKSEIKLIQSLRLKKFRQKYDLFVAEGHKTIITMLHHGVCDIHTIYASEPWATDHPEWKAITLIADSKELKSLSHLSQPPNVLATFKIPEGGTIKKAKKMIYLDDLQDPGNVGTIIRIADWFGYDTVIRSPQSADFYGTKTVMATMGSMGHVTLITMDQELAIQQMQDVHKIGLTMDGPPYQSKTHEKLCLVVGNEGHGLSKSWLKAIDVAYHIPGAAGRVAESLNAAIATGIAVSQIG